jgi:hypothetical protein
MCGYGLAARTDAAYTNVLETSEHGGYPLLDHLRKIIGSPAVWAPACAARWSSASPAATPLRGGRGPGRRL